jgi:SAM-dependent methyltransferase
MFEIVRTVYVKSRAASVAVFLGTLFRTVIPRCLACYRQLKPFFQGKVGLEIGGPTGKFRRSGLLPVYAVAHRVDNCNFSSNTIFEGIIKEGATFHFNRRRAPGHQYVAEATDLGAIASASYDFVLSSHTLEHVANPLLALSEWTRVLKEEGLFVLVLPHRDGTFDHNRPVTSMAHLIQDCERPVTEADLTHLEEALRLHDLATDPHVSDFDSFREMSERNIENRRLHHHVFDTRLAVEVVHQVGLQILAVEVFRPYDIFVLARKRIRGQVVQNEGYRGIDAAPVWHSPFPSDRVPQHRVG